MKTKMKFFAALAIMMGFAVSAMAQSAVTTPITAKATVQSKLVVTQVQALNFGTVDKVIAQTKVVSPAGVASSSGGSVAQTDVQEGVGKIVRSGGVVTYKLSSTPSELSGVTTTTSKLPIGNYTTAYSLATQAATPTVGNVTATSPTTVAAGTDDIYVHIGATVTPSAATTASEEHTATITLSAEYN